MTHTRVFERRTRAEKRLPRFFGGRFGRCHVQSYVLSHVHASTLRPSPRRHVYACKTCVCSKGHRRHRTLNTFLSLRSFSPFLSSHSVDRALDGCSQACTHVPVTDAVLSLTSHAATSHKVFTRPMLLLSPAAAPPALVSLLLLVLLTTLLVLTVPHTKTLLRLQDDRTQPCSKQNKALLGRTLETLSNENKQTEPKDEEMQMQVLRNLRNEEGSY